MASPVERRKLMLSQCLLFVDSRWIIRCIYSLQTRIQPLKWRKDDKGKRCLTRAYPFLYVTHTLNILHGCGLYYKHHDSASPITAQKYLGGAGACDSGAESPSRTYYSPSTGLLHLSEIYGIHTWLNRTSRSIQRSLILLTLQSLASCSSLLHILSSPHPCIGHAI